MNTPREDAATRSVDILDQSVERILGKASPRPVLSPEETEAVRENVQVAWRAVTKKRRTNRRLVSLSIAASIIIVVFAGFNSIRTGGMSETQVASISKSFGSIYMLGDNSELLEQNNVTAITAGQTIITDESSGIGFTWAEGGSLRIDENTRVEFLSRDSIRLQSGRVYFDSQPEMAAGSAATKARLTIVTDHGEVTHVGTQYMTQVDSNSLTISVREGQIRISSQSSTETASAGQQLEVRGGITSSVVNIKPYGESWQWIEQMSPATVLDGRSLHDFLGWVSHETGMSLEYAGEKIEADAKSNFLIGTVDTDPTNALRIWGLGNDFQWKIEDGVIHIDNNESGSGQSSGVEN